jgi:hypothetical protein
MISPGIGAVGEYAKYAIGFWLPTVSLLAGIVQRKDIASIAIATPVSNCFFTVSPSPPAIV